MWHCAHSFVHSATFMTVPAPASVPGPARAPLPLPAGLGAGGWGRGRASRRRPPGLAPGTRRPGQPATEPAEPADRRRQLGVGHIDFSLLPSGLGPLGLVKLIPRVHLKAPFGRFCRNSRKALFPRCSRRFAVREKRVTSARQWGRGRTGQAPRAVLRRLRGPRRGPMAAAERPAALPACPGEPGPAGQPGPRLRGALRRSGSARGRPFGLQGAVDGQGRARRARRTRRA